MSEDERKATGRQNGRPTIGVLTHGAGDPNSNAIWAGVADIARERDVNLICFPAQPLSSPHGFDAQANVLYDLARAENVDGLVFWGSVLTMYRAPEEVAGFCERYRPLPVVGVAIPLEGIPVVQLDNYEGMRGAMVHLVEVHGYRRIAFIRGPHTHPDAEERYRAYTDVLAEHDLSFNPDLVATGDFTRPSGAEAIRLLLDERKVDFEAVVAANDVMALDAIEALQARGIQVPDDVAVVGFDDLEDSRHITPPLTTVPVLFRELGRQATEMVLALLQGEEVPEQVILPTTVIVRQSCGCLSPEVVQAAAGQVDRADQGFEDALATERAHILFDMAQAAGVHSVGVVPDWVEQLLDSFSAELKGETRGAFLLALDRILRQVAAVGGDVTAWQGAISALRLHLLPHLNNEALSRAEDLWSQARVMIGETAQRVQAQQRVLEEQQAMKLREIGQALITTYDMAELTGVLAQELPRIDIKRGYLSLYENPGAPTEWSRLILAYDENGRAELGADKQRFSSRQLVPEGLLPRDGRYGIVVEPLYFRENQLGFAVLEAGPREERICDTLRGHISSALQGASLVQQVEERSRALQEANYALQRRAIELEASAEVGRAITSIFDVDELFRQTVELIRERFDFYHAGIFLLDEAGEWAVLQEATGDAGEQMKAQGHRLAVDDTSMVGWTALHRQARIALDVGEDAVRFANPLLPNTRSEMTLPLMVGKQVLGVLNVQSTEEAAFDQDDVRALQSMADQVAIAIENARRISDEAALLEATSPIYRASRHLTTATTTDEVADAIIASVAETGADGCTVVEFELSPAGEPEALLYRGVWRRDREPQFKPGMRLPIAESPFPLEMVSTLWMVADVEQDDRVPRSARVVFQATSVKALVNIPLRSGERVIGQVVVIRATPGPFPDAALRLYEVLSDQAAVALERAQLLEQTQRRATQEQQARQMIDHIRRAADTEHALQTAAEELSRAMDVPHVSIELSLEAPTHE
jgi:DNA-binding LacI/PurR family transcriptional regulator/GAF domain-containing protein